MILTFGEFKLDSERFELRCNGLPFKVEPKVFDLLSLLIQHPGQVFSRDDLISVVWKGRMVSDATVSTCVKSARKALGDSGDSQHYITTVRGRGFSFNAEVESDSFAADSAVNTPSEHALPQGGVGPSLLVLPFRSMVDDPETTCLAEGVSSGLGTILTRIPLLRLSYQAARYTKSDIIPTVRAIYEHVGVDYVLEGVLQNHDAGYRINVKLIDAKSGFLLWAEHFFVPGPHDAALDLAVTAVIAKLEPQLYRAIYHSVCAAGGERSAQGLFLEASSMLALKGWHPDSFTSAAELLRRSCRLASDFALAHAYLALVIGLGDRIGLLGDRERARVEALETAERALELDSMDSTVLGFAGCALADIGYPGRALPILKNAVEINPDNAQAWAALGSACLLSGQVEEAVQYLTHGINISPLDSRLSIWGAVLALALMMAKDMESAVRQAELACQRDHRNYLPRIVLAGIRLIRNEQELALKALKDAYRIKPDLTPAQVLPLLGQKLGHDLLNLK
ncbi:MAG: winged helix-turn-helix domain-containing protein [Desulfuromonadaceae bacterium]|nr:winged helix-turn-helix domain-containing protein [Desulfuromonadaceae bacterium]